VEGVDARCESKGIGSFPPVKCECADAKNELWNPPRAGEKGFCALITVVDEESLEDADAAEEDLIAGEEEASGDRKAGKQFLAVIPDSYEVTIPLEQAVDPSWERLSKELQKIVARTRDPMMVSWRLVLSSSVSVYT